MSAPSLLSRRVFSLALGIVAGAGVGWGVFGRWQQPAARLPQVAPIVGPAAKPPNLTGMGGPLDALDDADLWKRLETLSNEDLEREAQAILTEAGSDRVGAAAVAILSQRDPAHGWTVALGLHHAAIIGEAFATFVEADPEKAARALTELEPWVVKKGIMGGGPEGVWPKLLATLARRLPDRAFEIAMARSGRDAGVLSEFLTDLSAIDRTAAIRMAEKLPGSTVTQKAHLAFVKAWAAEDPSATLAWARQHLGAKQYRAAQQEVLGSLSTAELVDVVDQLPRGAAQPAACHRIAERWIEENPAQCLAWARGLSAPAQRVAALTAAAEKLATKNPVQTLALINDLPDPARQRDLAAKAVAAWAKSDATSAMAYASKIEDPATRQACIDAAKPSLPAEAPLRLFEGSKSKPASPSTPASLDAIQLKF